jgi:hypothetical protein
MQVSEQFLKAKRDKNARALVVVKRKDRLFMYLCFELTDKYTDAITHQFIETDTTFRITNYSTGIPDTVEREGKTDFICFHLPITGIDGPNHVRTFLNAIKKDSDVYFRIVAYNGCDYYKELGLVSHQLYGIVDNNRYLLDNYVGKDGHMSPVREAEYM